MVLMWDLVLLGLLGCGRVVINDVLRALLLMQGLFLLLLVLEFPIMFLRERTVTSTCLTLALSMSLARMQLLLVVVELVVVLLVLFSILGSVWATLAVVALARSAVNVGSGLTMISQYN